MAMVSTDLPQRGDRALIEIEQAYVPAALGRPGVEMYQKGHSQPMFARMSMAASDSEGSDGSDLDTEFEEDDGDFDDYQGRRSEESYSNTTVSACEELRTPASNDFQGFNFGLPIKQDKSEPPKPVQGPVGPHLFRHSQQSLPEQDIYLEWSPLDSPKRAGPTTKQTRASLEVAPPTGTPLETWTTHQVTGWMKAVGFEQSIIERFRVNDISGGILKHLEFGDLKELGIASFGHRHLLWDEIRNLRRGLCVPATPGVSSCSPSPPLEQDFRRQSPSNECSDPSIPEGQETKAPKLARRRARRALRSDDIISPAESASIVAIEQLLPEPHQCSKGEDCPKWRKYKRKMDKIAKEFPLELEQIGEANTSPSEVTVRPTSEAMPSVVASSDLLGPGNRPALRLHENFLRVVQNRDPQENVRQFLTFQHMADSPNEPSTPPYEMFPPLSPPSNTQAPHGNLSTLPKLHIPTQTSQEVHDQDLTIIQQHRSPITAIQSNGQDIYRFASPASAMDVPVTALPLGPIERDASNSVPPDMRYGVEPVSRSQSQASRRFQSFSPMDRSQSVQPLERSASHSQRRDHPRFAMAAVEEGHLPTINDVAEKTPTATDGNHAGWMKKRRTKMLRHEWQENHFRLKGTTLAMHRDSKTIDPLELIDVDEYAVACSSIASNKLNTAFKSFKISSSSNKKKAETDSSAFTFQLVPAAEKKGRLGAVTAKTHHFAVKDRNQRIDWMRELMLAKALRQKAEGCEVNVNGHAVA